MPEHRPQAHLRPEHGWTNDPIGPVRWQGRTHLFHQVNPEGGYWDRPHWGHVVTDDLVRWHRRPIALSPSPDGPDADGCYSGCVVTDGEAAVMFYTGARGPLGKSQQQTTCVARSDDPLLDRWTKDPGNPVTLPPEGAAALVGFRDPFVWKEHGRWWQLVGSGIRGVGGAALLFSAADLSSEWYHEGPLLVASDLDGTEWTGSMWECPALLRGPDGDALVISVHDEETTHHPLVILGHVEGTRFVPSTSHRLDLGPELYAPCLYVDGTGRVIMWGWSWEARSAARQREEGWAGVLSAPRQLTIEGDRVCVAPLPELAQLRGQRLEVGRVPTADGWLAAGVDGDTLDLELDLRTSDEPVELRLRRAPGMEEVTRLVLHRGRGEIWFDRNDASLDPSAAGGRFGGRVARTDLDRGVRVVLDRSIVEVFVGGRVALTARIYPTRDDSTGVELAGAEDAVGAAQLRAWSLGSIWADDPAADAGTVT
jgi:beta-fructofuranosidase